MPSKAFLKRINEKERKRGKQLSGCSSKDFIPNRPLQGEMIRDGKRVLGRSRTYPGCPGRLSQRNMSRSYIRKSVSLNNVNAPRFSKLKYGEKLPFVGCDNCTPWHICDEHENWLTLPGRGILSSPILTTASNTSSVTTLLTSTPIYISETQAIHRYQRVVEKKRQRGDMLGQVVAKRMYQHHVVRKILIRLLMTLIRS